MCLSLRFSAKIRLETLCAFYRHPGKRKVATEHAISISISIRVLASVSASSGVADETDAGVALSVVLSAAGEGGRRPLSMQPCLSGLSQAR